MGNGPAELSANFCGPYVIERRIGMTDYLVRTPDRRKKYQLCHINMLKPYYRNESSPTPAPVVRATAVVTTVGEDVDVDCEFWDCRWLENVEAGTTLKAKLSYLPPDQST
ncbi:hypothetical protein Pcinc_012188 [Petrolisthes cinctipes]|nr:hypothetical protein Pcinc_012188 [Petrolisthes cinctipes]